MIVDPKPNVKEFYRRMVVLLSIVAFGVIAHSTIAKAKKKSSFSTPGLNQLVPKGDPWSSKDGYSLMPSDDMRFTLLGSSLVEAYTGAAEAAFRAFTSFPAIPSDLQQALSKFLRTRFSSKH